MRIRNCPPRTQRDTLATYIPKLAAVPLDFQPGTLWRYSGQAGFNVMSRIVEDPVAARLAVSKGAYGWAGGTGVSFWIEPAEEMIVVYMVQGGSGGQLRRAFERGVRQSIID